MPGYQREGHRAATEREGHRAGGSQSGRATEREGHRAGGPQSGRATEREGHRAGGPSPYAWSRWVKSSAEPLGRFQGPQLQAQFQRALPRDTTTACLV